MLKDEWIRIEYPYTQLQVQEIISAIFKDEADDELNRIVSNLMRKLEEICKIEDKDARMQAFEKLARERDELLSALINNQK